MEADNNKKNKDNNGVIGAGTTTTTTTTNSSSVTEQVRMIPPEIEKELQQQQQQQQHPKSRISVPQYMLTFQPFNEMLFMLLQFKYENKHCNVPLRHFLYPWVLHMRRQYININTKDLNPTYEANKYNNNNNNNNNDDDDVPSTDLNYLSPERINVLNAIEFSWSTPTDPFKDILSKNWCEHFNLLLDFVKQHGHFYPSNKESPILHRWVKKQRQLKAEADANAKVNAKVNVHAALLKKSQLDKIQKLETRGVTLSQEERFAKLDSIGFDWRLILGRGNSLESEMKWNKNFNALIDFKKKHGHWNPTKTDSQELCKWVSEQRAQKILHDKTINLDQKLEDQKLGSELLTQEQKIAKLISIGFFVWEYDNNKRDKWDENYLKLIKYKAIHGHCNVSVTDHANLKLALWVGKQRMERSKRLNGKIDSSLTVEREAQLNEIGFEWVAPGRKKRKYIDDDEKMKMSQTNFHVQGKKLKLEPLESWEKYFNELVAFKEKHGHCYVNSNHKNTLYAWVKHQRNQKLLYDEIMEEKQQQQQPPPNNDDNNNNDTTEALSNNNNINNEQKILLDQQQERMALLMSIGFSWNRKKEAWDDNYQALVEYKQIYGHCNVSTNDPTYKKLGCWLSRQRSEYAKKLRGINNNVKLTDEKIARLTTLGIIWVVPKGINRKFMDDFTLKKKYNNNNNNDDDQNGNASDDTESTM